MASVDARLERRARELSDIVAPYLSKGRLFRESAYRSIVIREPRVAYVVIADFRTGYRKGVINSAILQQGAEEIREFRDSYGDEVTLAKLIQPAAGFAGEYVRVVTVNFLPPKTAANKMPWGVLKIGYVVPGFPFGMGYQNILWTLMMFLGLCGAGWLLAICHYQRRVVPRRRIPLPLPSPKKDDLEALEDELTQSEALEVDAEGKTWKVLFNGNSLEGWVTKGNWYISDEELVAQPWGSSLVSTRAPSDGNYIYCVEAKHVAGRDAFLLLFDCEGKSLWWMIGGWNNSKSEVGGYADTRTEGPLERNKWYDLEIKVDAKEVVGRLNGKKKWSLLRSKIFESSPEVGFETGIGLAVWSGLSKFRNIRFRTS